MEANNLRYCGGFCHTLTWISHGCTCVPYPKPPSHLPPHPIPLGCPSAPALSALFHALNMDCSSILRMVIYMLQCYSLKSSHPHLLPQSSKVCSSYLCLFCCLTHRVIVTIFLNSIAKSHQSCPTLCDPIDGSPPGSPDSGILQAVLIPACESSSPARDGLYI